MDERHRQLADLLGLTPTNPWLWQLTEYQLCSYLIDAEAGLFGAIPLPIWSTGNGLQVLGDPAYHERRKRASYTA